MKPKISLIIPVYNVEEYLGKCLNTAVNQTLKDIEIIIVNDGSTDGSLAICKRYLSDDSRIVLISQKNSGLSSARNAAIDLAKGEYIAFLDGDDWLELEGMEIVYQRALKDNLDIVIYRYNKVDGFCNVLHTSSIKDIYKQSELKSMALSVRTSPMSCDKLYRKQLFISHNIRFPQGLYHEDVYTTYKLMYFSKKTAVVEKALYNWLVREGSISKSISKKHIDDVLGSFEQVKYFLKTNSCFERYEREYVRRVYSLSLLMLGKVKASNGSERSKVKLVDLVWNALKKKGFLNKKTLKMLKMYDYQLYSRFLKLRKRQYKKMSVTRKIFDKIFPKKSGRRKIIKYLLGRKETPNNVKPKSNMSAVRLEITAEEKKKLIHLKDKFKGKRCFIVGNGPSLNKCDLSLLKDELTFAVNGIFYKTDEMAFKPTFYMVEDGHVIDDNLDRINSYDPLYKFFPALYKDKIKSTDKTFFFTADLGFYRKDHPSFEKPRFSMNFSDVSYCGQSVTYLNMQLAYYFGFSEVYLIGMDFSYQIRETDEVRGQTLVSNEDDVNHFHPDYFGKGKKWHDPKVYNVAKSYEFAKENFEADGRKIYNATAGGKLEIFERVNYELLF